MRRGEYLDPVLDRLGRLSPWGDWAACTLTTLILAGVIGWLLPLAPVAMLWPHFDKNNASQVLPVYLTCVGIWVVPISAWLGIRTLLNVRRERG
jgi:hypothetical protein